MSFPKDINYHTNRQINQYAMGGCGDIKDAKEKQTCYSNQVNTNNDMLNLASGNGFNNGDRTKWAYDKMYWWKTKPLHQPLMGMAQMHVGGDSIGVGLGDFGTHWFKWGITHKVLNKGNCWPIPPGK